MNIPLRNVPANYGGLSKGILAYFCSISSGYVSRLIFTIGRTSQEIHSRRDKKENIGLFDLGTYDQLTIKSMFFNHIPSGSRGSTILTEIDMKISSVNCR